MKVDVKISDQLTKRTQSQTTALNKLPEQAFKEWLEATPIRSGNARRRTTRRDDTIDAKYAYAQRLDTGYSKQAPEGMTKPVQEWYIKQVQKIFGR